MHCGPFDSKRTITLQGILLTRLSKATDIAFLTRTNLAVLGAPQMTPDDPQQLLHTTGGLWVKQRLNPS